MQDDLQQQLVFPENFGSPQGVMGQSRSRSNSDLSDQSRESLLSGSSNVRASFSFKAQLVTETKRKAEDEKFDKYRLKLKALSLFFIAFSTFILMNAAIGASSAPFYDKYTECNKLSLTTNCKELMKYSNALYGFEVIGSIILSIHGILGMTLLDYIKRIWLIRTLNYYTKGALILYIVDALLRTAMYLKILNLIRPVEETNHTQDFGGFLAVYCDNDALGVIITSILLGVYGTCFLGTCFMWRLTAQLHQTANEIQEENDRLESRRSSSRASSIASKKDKNDNSSTHYSGSEDLEDSINNVKNDEIDSENDEDDTATAKRALKASQVILSINDGGHDSDNDENQTELMVKSQGIAGSSSDKRELHEPYDRQLVANQIEEEPYVPDATF